ncbi:nucleotidyltransferase [Thermococcus kodakarensis KOD1]|uniref:Nucleotidyltransferase n=1 Tax=Thermococcus kodakarensis (strain ATCC BAA-918 / JCM 12380 / KOD1) TaxID=69014 RepID=Q5JJC4_THEKO|nr:nucleotidyltransferase domain-containing protein [Thermococcus kodakarensis]WCN27441.1 nucleotidyltransferase domain-containing protein [Thermococcus kodakarensis]WCN29731.1 nucleotidyltransferase domain-containing protein [Thermococcus kodakarensis]BAD85665.1 nucleotidyltransferase [Thermococcus kodakarensis KOD1]
MNLDEAVARILQLGGDKVKFIILFGSRARGDARKDSDYDLCVYYEGNEKEAFRFRVLVLGNLPDKYDVQIFQLLPLPLKRECLKGKILFCRDETFLYDLAYEVLKEWEDFKRYYYDYLGLEAIE